MKVRIEYPPSPAPLPGDTTAWLASSYSGSSYVDIELDGNAVPAVGDGFVLAGRGLTITARIWLADPNTLGVSAILKTTPSAGMPPT